jgi:hypothetical protein
MDLANAPTCVFLAKSSVSLTLKPFHHAHDLGAPFSRDGKMIPAALCGIGHEAHPVAFDVDLAFAPDPLPNASCKRQRLNKPARVTSLTAVDVSRALGAIPGEFGAVLAQKILEKRMDGDQLLDWLNSVEAKEEDPIATNVFCKHSDLFGPFLNRVSWDRLCSADRQICVSSRSVTPPATETPSGGLTSQFSGIFTRR